jgi:hypothetical protein
MTIPDYHWNGAVRGTVFGVDYMNQGIKATFQRGTVVLISYVTYARVPCRSVGRGMYGSNSRDYRPQEGA